ncbi:LysE family translocator [Anaerophilus nitritogenes]|uniref:LysE family translocator n=1 Tax=Anaerophilus nitritogenes TaxID=2498136 RepID=UPI0013EB56BD|nr:LysE family transporter [Anaerophilus nitritogenes]
MIDILKGIIMGMIIAIPVGPIGILSIQRSIHKGWKEGFLSGIGGATSDMVYSSMAILGMDYIDVFLEKHTSLIYYITGSVFLIIGVNIFIQAIKNKKKKKKFEEESIHPYISTFFMGISNPMTFFIFLAMFTKFDIHVNEEILIQQVTFIAAIFSGSCMSWFLISNFIQYSKKDYKIENFTLVDKVVGCMISLLGIVNIVKGMIRC